MLRNKSEEQRPSANKGNRAPLRPMPKQVIEVPQAELTTRAVDTRLTSSYSRAIRRQLAAILVRSRVIIGAGKGRTAEDRR